MQKESQESAKDCCGGRKAQSSNVATNLKLVSGQGTERGGGLWWEGGLHWIPKLERSRLDLRKKPGYPQRADIPGKPGEIRRTRRVGRARASRRIFRNLRKSHETLGSARPCRRASIIAEGRSCRGCVCVCV